MLGKRDGIPAADDGQTETRLLMTDGRKRRRLVLYKYHTLVEETPPIGSGAQQIYDSSPCEQDEYCPRPPWSSGMPRSS